MSFLETSMQLTGNQPFHISGHDSPLSRSEKSFHFLMINPISSLQFLKLKNNCCLLVVLECGNRKIVDLTLVLKA